MTVGGVVAGEIGPGLMILVAAAEADDDSAASTLASKIAGLRIFPDDEGKMNLDVRQVSGSVLIVSQFTLMGDCRKGRRPSFVKAGRPESARQKYDQFVAAMSDLGIPVQTGVFRADMQVTLVNDGPVTLLVDTEKAF